MLASSKLVMMYFKDTQVQIQEQCVLLITHEPGTIKSEHGFEQISCHWHRAQAHGQYPQDLQGVTCLQRHTD